MKRKLDQAFEEGAAINQKQCEAIMARHLLIPVVEAMDVLLRNGQTGYAMLLLLRLKNELHNVAGIEKRGLVL